jgi:transcription initiation factor TFIID subunit TAF12
MTTNKQQQQQQQQQQQKQVSHKLSHVLFSQTHPHINKPGENIKVSEELLFVITIHEDSLLG